MMKRQISLVPLLWSLVVVVLIVFCIYSAWQINRQEKRLVSLQTLVANNSEQLSTVVNFINSSVAEQAKK